MKQGTFFLFEKNKNFKQTLLKFFESFISTVNLTNFPFLGGTICQIFEIEK